MLKDECILAHSNETKVKMQKAVNAEIKQKIEDLEPLKYWVKKAQIAVNTYIRFRDKDKPCISCGRKLGSKFDAGHYFSTGANPELRFEEDNIHGQCVFCNQHLHGNLIPYTDNLPERIGLERFNALKDKRHKIRKYSKDELKQIIEIYKNKIK